MVNRQAYRCFKHNSQQVLYEYTFKAAEAAGCRNHGRF
jgi:hypothetical protein